RQVGRRADRPAYDVSRYNAPRDRLSGDLFPQESLEVQGALAMTREDDRPFARLRDEAIEGRRDIVVRKVERCLRVLTVQKECPERRLAVTGRPDLSGAVERARLASDEEPAAEFGVADEVERRIPAVALEVSRRMDIKDCGISRLD